MIRTSKHLKKVSQYQPPSRKRSRKVKLDLNENMLGCSPKVLDALKNIDWENISCYPEYDLLIEKTAAHYHVKPEQILFTNGGDDAIRCAIDTYIMESDRVLLPVPTF